MMLSFHKKTGELPMSVAFTNYAEFKTELKALKAQVSENIGKSNKFNLLTDCLTNLAERIQGLNPEDLILAQAKLVPVAISIRKMERTIQGSEPREGVKLDLETLGIILPNEAYRERRSSLSKAMNPTAVAVS